jgi:hypothetical protein
MAFGVNLPSQPKNCHLSVHGTASHLTFQPSGVSPENTTWPFISWSVDITDENGAIACTQHALDSGDGVVSTNYTKMTGATFQHEWQCGSPTIDSPTLACAGELEGGASAQVYPTPSGLSVSIAGQRSRPYELPEGYHLGQDAACCVNPCCVE